ncbi:MAG: ATP-dependent DNA helicase [Lachnospiraceae bacterium]|nr:ATP-dependent DNA helicase [Lachnospiraceae bacterium]
MEGERKHSKHSTQSIRISVRNLVEFLFRSGDIDHRGRLRTENAMLEGGRIHRLLQSRMKSDYQAEVALRFVHYGEEYELVIEGRADGIFPKRRKEPSVTVIDSLQEVVSLRDPEEIMVVDEIKGTYRETGGIEEPEPVHLAQAKCYAFMYAAGHSAMLLTRSVTPSVGVRMTYCNMDTLEIRYFEYVYEVSELEEWFMTLLASYDKWAKMEIAWKKLRQSSIRQLKFPYPYREGQKELAAAVYRTVYHKRKLFLEAPTGVGKTLSVLFPAIKALGEGLSDRVFYLTARTMTGKVAEETFSLLRERGLHFKPITLTAKDKICFLGEPDCDPNACPYARGHMDRINDAVFDILTHEEVFDRETILKYAAAHTVCPFEFGLDISLFADGIIGDYNYLFDPHVYLKRFFGGGSGDAGIFLVDEAHNLVDRGREMYSAVLNKKALLTLKGLVKAYNGRMVKQLEKCNRRMLALKRMEKKVLTGEDVEPLILALNRLSSIISEYLQEKEESPVRKEILAFYFILSHFLLMYDGMGEEYLIYSSLEEEGDFLIKLFCVDPADKLKVRMQRGRSSILFSATMIPVQYYKKLLGGRGEDYEIYAKSPFRKENRGVFVARDVTSRYTRRTEEEFEKIASYIHRVISVRQGNYMVFAPSYAMMRRIYQIYEMRYGSEEGVECIMQKESMDEREREAFLERYEYCRDTTLVGFCVMGGIFSEGIDLKRDRLIGTLLIGTGLPGICEERRLLQEYFDHRRENGFDHAYRFPGMNKVLQAAGRVIRTEEDRGVVVLLDERFLQREYVRMFPAEWANYKVTDLEKVEEELRKFWGE